MSIRKNSVIIPTTITGIYISSVISVIRPTINSTIDISAIQKRIISKVVVYLISILLLIINCYYIKRLTNLFSTPSEIRTHTGIAAQGIFVPL